MMPCRLIVFSCSALLYGIVTAPGAALNAQAPKQDAQAESTPVSYVCPMHPDVVEAQKGTCPICRMNLVPVRLESIWSCPVHSVVAESQGGKCRICGRDLIQLTVALTWTCAGHPEIDQIDRGKCPDGTPMIAKRSPRPHGNHNPQHGGQFFMAPDNTHHLEGAYPTAGLFRLYLYDDYTKPLALDQVKHVKGRVVTNETFDAATRTTKEVRSSPLTLTRNGRYLEARIDRARPPAEMSAKVKFKDDGPEYRFDFTFAALSKEPIAPSSPQLTRKDALPGLAAAPMPAVPAASTADPSLIPLPIPETVEGILAQLRTRREQIGQLIQRGAFADVYVPAFQAKDLALALEPRTGELSPAKQEIAEPAIKSVVRTAWLLDAFGDLGNRQQIDDAYSLFTAAVTNVESVFSRRR
jgi:hypothetical protein